MRSSEHYTLIFKAKTFISFFLLLCGFQIHCQAQEFPNGLSLIQYLQGVNSTKVPKVISCDLTYDYYEDHVGPEFAKEYFLCGNEHLLIYDKIAGFNGKFHFGDSLRIILKNELVYESEIIDIENFLLFGIFKNPPENSIERLKKLGIDTDRVDEGIRLGRSMWIIGAERRDPESPQLWIDKEYLTAKKIHYINLPQKEIQVMEFSRFQRVNDFYLAKETEYKTEPLIIFKSYRKNFEILEAIPTELRDKALFNP